jgi:hypothetical protein
VPGRSASPGAEPQPVAVRVAQLEVAAVRLLAHWPPELGHDSVYVIDHQAHERVRARVTEMFGQEQPDRAPRD